MNVDILNTLAGRFKQIGFPAEIIEQRKLGLLIDKNRVLVREPAPGIRLEARETEKGAEVKVYIEPGTKIKEPVNICFTMGETGGEQEISTEILVGEDADVTFKVYGAVADGLSVNHKARTRVTVKKNARFIYDDEHYYGDNSSIVLENYTEAEIEEGAYYLSSFKRAKGRVGNARITLKATVGDRATAVFETKLLGKKDDKIKVTDIINLEGEEARGISKSRIIALDSTYAEFVGETYGNGSYSRGHIDCSEVIRGRDVVLKAVPIVVVNNETAKVTHEAAIGSLDKKQLETLMARGLSEDEAVDVIVQGMLR
ncbi:SufB/SufD family protein [Desulfurobacterium sp.]